MSGRACFDGLCRAGAGKLAVLAWHLLTRGEDYAFARPGVVARKRRRLELAAGAPRRKSGPNGNPVWASTAQHRTERRIAEQAETAYRRLITDWQASGPRVGAGATPGRASERPSKAMQRGRPPSPSDLRFSSSSVPAPAISPAKEAAAVPAD